MAPGRGGLKAVAGLLMVGVTATAGAAAAPAGAHMRPAVRPTQELTRLLTPHRVLMRLSSRRSKAGVVSPERPITGGPTVLPVLSHATTRSGVRWLRVRVPGRPNGRRGWIRARGSVPRGTSWHVVVRTGSRRVFIYRWGRRVRSFAAVVGKPSTPTPRGRFFVEESVRMRVGSAGAPFALALSARSKVLQSFGGGPGQIALHGVDSLGGRPGTAVSHGCVRLADRPIRWVAARIGPGVPVTITR